MGEAVAAAAPEWDWPCRRSGATGPSARAAGSTGATGRHVVSPYDELTVRRIRVSGVCAAAGAGIVETLRVLGVA